MPDDGLLVRPYVAAPGPPASAANGPTWPEGAAPPVPAPSTAPAVSVVPDRRVRGGRAPALLALLALLGLSVAGALVFLPGGPDPGPGRASAPPGLSVPVLPARSPDTDPAPPSATPDRPKASTPAPVRATPSAPGSRPGSTPGGGPSGVVPPTPAEDSATLRQGDKGPEVRVLQQRLYAQGFTYVAVTGVYDGRTRRGVAQLQSDRDIKGDPPGVYGPATRAAFG